MACQVTTANMAASTSPTKKKFGGREKIKKCYRATGVHCYPALFCLWAGKIELLRNCVQQY